MRRLPSVCGSNDPCVSASADSQPDCGHRILGAVLNSIAVALLLLTGNFALAQNPKIQPTTAEARCEALAKADYSDIPDAPTQLLSARVVAENGNKPSFCHIRGYVSPQVGFELRLPLYGWNGKFLQLGTGGWGGNISGECSNFFGRGYACVESDSGHQGNGGDGLWASDNLQAELDFAYRGVHVTSLAARAITERFYAQRPRYSYFFGCSTGGYQGLVEAERFPWDFDGIIAGAPDMDEADLSARELWARRALLDQSGRPVLDDAALEVLHAAALKACDADDGVLDGIIGNPLACYPPLKDTICKPGQSERCLTEPQAMAAEKMYEGPPSFLRSVRGALPGSEHTWVKNLINPGYVDSFFRHMVYGLNTLSTANFDFDRDYQRLGLAAIYTDSNPDLRRFKSSGAKLLMYQGENDTTEMPTAAVDFYQSVELLMGGAKATQSFFRLFMVPAMTHCGGGEGPYMVDYLAAMEAWVERAQPPDELMGLHPDDDYLAAQPLPEGLPPEFIATLTREDRIALIADELRFPLDPALPIVFARPIYPYPLVARYRGKGKKNEASNFMAVSSR